MRSEQVDGYLEDIRENIKLATFIHGLPVEEFANDTLRLYAVIRCLEIISEASRRLPPALKERHPDIGWQKIAGAGNIYRHDYDDVGPRRVWETVHVALPHLRDVVESELSSPDSESR